jgi:hypothetical protein
MELIGEIRRMAFSLIDSKIKADSFLEIEDEPFINLFDRWEVNPSKDEVSEVLFPDGIGGTESDDADLKSLFDQFAIDKKKLIQRIDSMLIDKTQITLKEIIDHYGLENGLSEVVGYFSIATSSNHHIIIDGTVEQIKIGNRRVNVPMVIYTKPYQ